MYSLSVIKNTKQLFLYLQWFINCIHNFPVLKLKIKKHICDEESLLQYFFFSANTMKKYSVIKHLFLSVNNLYVSILIAPKDNTLFVLQD